jgi:hypothetical protein
VNFIHIDDGSRGIEQHLVGHTMKQFDRHTKEALEEGELFREFVKCLDGPTLHMWELIVSGQYPDDKDKNKTNLEQAQKLLKNEVCGYNDMHDTQIFLMNHMMKKPKSMSSRDLSTSARQECCLMCSCIRSNRSFNNLPRQLKGLRLKRSLTSFRFDTILKQGRHNWHVQQANTRGKMMIITLVHQTRNSAVEIDAANKMALVMRR